MISNLKDLYLLRLYSFPKKIKNLKFLSYSDGTFVGIDDIGRVFTNHANKRRRGCKIIEFNHLSQWQRVNVIKALISLGKVSEEMMMIYQEDMKKEENRSSARWHLSNAKDLARLGVPYNSIQLRRLKNLSLLGNDL